MSETTVEVAETVSVLNGACACPVVIKVGPDRVKPGKTPDETYIDDGHALFEALYDSLPARTFKAMVSFYLNSELVDQLVEASAHPEEMDDSVNDVIGLLEDEATKE